MSRGSLAVLLGGMFVVMVGFGVIIPVLPFYVLHFGASSIHLGLLMATYSTMQFIFAPLWGAVSDRVGRRPVLLFGLAGFTLSFLLFALATRLWMLFAARALAGLLSSATLPAAMAYVSDTTSEENRGGGMGLIGAVMGLGMVFGPAIGGLLTGFTIQTPFYVAAAMGAVNLAVGLAFLPESLPGARGWRALRRGSCSASAAGSAAPASGAAVTVGLGQPAAPASGAAVTPSRSGRWALARGPLLLLFVLAFTVSFAMAGFQSTFALYLNSKLGYRSSEMGLIFAVMGLIGVVAQGVIVARLMRRFGEATVVRWGLLISLAGLLVVVGLSGLGTAILFASLFSFGNSLTRPAIATLVSKRSPAGQGVSLGTMQSFDSLGRIAGPLWGGVAFYVLRELPFFTGAAVLALALGATLVWASLLAGSGPRPAAGNAVTREASEPLAHGDQPDRSNTQGVRGLTDPKRRSTDERIGQGGPRLNGSDREVHR